MQDARTRAALLVICLVCLIGSGYILLTGRQAAPPPIVLSAPPASLASDALTDTPHGKAPLAAVVPKRPSRVYVDVAGAVRRPALYLLPSGSRVMQAVRAAGGPTDAADLDAVNLAQPITDGQKVFVPEHIAAVSPASAVPTTPLRSGGQGHAAKDGTKEEAGGKLKAGSSEQIGLNSATAEQLQRLPTVGPSMAARILAYRQQAGGFSKIEDLMLVTGIGPKKFAKIAPFVSLN